METTQTIFVQTCLHITTMVYTLVLSAANSTIISLSQVCKTNLLFDQIIDNKQNRLVARPIYLREITPMVKPKYRRWTKRSSIRSTSCRRQWQQLQLTVCKRHLYYPQKKSISFSLNIGLNMFPFDSFMSCLHSLLGYSTGEFQASQLIVLAAFGAVD